MVASIQPHRDGLGLGDGLMLIGGRWAAAANGTWSHLHPPTEKQVASFPVASPADVDGVGKTVLLRRQLELARPGGHDRRLLGRHGGLSISLTLRA